MPPRTSLFTSRFLTTVRDGRGRAVDTVLPGHTVRVLPPVQHGDKQMCMIVDRIWWRGDGGRQPTYLTYAFADANGNTVYNGTLKDN